MTAIYSDVASVIARVNEVFDARVEYEKSKSAAASMFASLEDFRKTLAHERNATVLLAMNVDVNFVNRHERSNARFNKHAIKKFVRIVQNLDANIVTIDHYMKHIMLTMRAFQNADLAMTQNDAMIACTNDVKNKNKQKEALTSHYNESTQMNTQSTQASSAINVLQICNFVREYKNSANMSEFVLDLDNDLVKKLFENIENRQ